MARFGEAMFERLPDLAAELVRLKVDLLVISGGAATEAGRRATSVIAILWNAADRGMMVRYREIEKAARVLQVEVQPIGMRGPEDFAAAFATMTRRKPDAIFLVSDALTNVNRKQVIDFAAANHIPAMYEFSFYVREGGLMSYGSSFDDEYREAAGYIDRILKGAKPSDLPAAQPTRHYLTVNRKAAAALGLTMPPTIQVRIDELVE